MPAVVPYVAEEYTVDKLMDKTGSITTRPEYVGWGTGGGTPPTKSSTTLTTPASESRVLATVTKTGSGQTAQYQAVATITANGSKTINEVGLFTASAAGTAFVLSDHTGVAVVLNDSIQYTITVDPS